MEEKETVEVKETVNVEEQLKKELEKALATIEEYKKAYQELNTKYNRLYAMLGNNIEFTLNLK